MESPAGYFTDLCDAPKPKRSLLPKPQNHTLLGNRTVKNASQMQIYRTIRIYRRHYIESKTLEVCLFSIGYATIYFAAVILTSRDITRDPSHERERRLEKISVRI